jgi:transcriptional regulator with XRE-family HTH domain
METNYHHRSNDVNHHCCFTQYKHGCIVQSMNLAERIQTARKHAALTQGGLAEKAGISQQAISRLETGEQKTTTDIVQIAVACGVRPEWLAMESGDMVDGLYVHDEKLKQLLKIAQELPEYGKDKAIREVTEIVEFIEQAAKAAKQ